MATARQLTVYGLHRTLCMALGIPQSTLKHKSLQGTLSPPSATGNVVYSAPNATTTGPTTVDTLVWFGSEPKLIRSGPGTETEIGRQGIPSMLGQIPAIDDSGTYITIADDDYIVDASNTRYRISSPTPGPDNAFWQFEMKEER